jgi:hypothetical protein
MLGTLALSAIWIAIVVAYRIIRSCLKTPSKLPAQPSETARPQQLSAETNAAEAREFVAAIRRQPCKEAEWMLRAKTLQALSIPQRRPFGPLPSMKPTNTLPTRSIR